MQARACQAPAQEREDHAIFRQLSEQCPSADKYAAVGKLAQQMLAYDVGDRINVEVALTADYFQL